VDIYDLVAKMREAQRQYFKTRGTDELRKSKALEREVDQAVRDRGQRKLFEEGQGHE